MRRRARGYLLLFAALLINSGLTIAFKAASNIGYVQLLLLVSIAGTAASALLMLLEGTQGEVAYYLTHPRPFALMALWAVLVYTLLELIFGYSTHYVSASLAAVIYRTYPLMLVLMAPFILRERISAWDLAGVAVGFSGLVLALALSGGLGISRAAMPFVPLLLLGAFFDALASAVSKRYYYDIYSSIFMYNALSLLVFLALALATGSFTLRGMTPVDWAAVAFLGVFQNVLLTYAFVGSLRVTNTALASNLYLLSPFITVVLSYLLLGERMFLSYFIIAAAVAAGVVIHLALSESPGFIAGQPVEGFKVYDVTSAFVGTKNREIYEAMRGEGRVLGLLVQRGRASFKATEEDVLGQAPLRASGDRGPLLLFSIKSAGLSQDDAEFIYKITGLNEGEDLLFLMAGSPAMLARAADIIRKALSRLSTCHP